MITVKEIEQRMIDDFTTLEAFNYAKTNQPDAVVEELTDRLDDEGIDYDLVNLEELQFDLKPIDTIPLSDFAESEEEFINQLGSLDTYMNNYFYDRLGDSYNLMPHVRITNIDDIKADLGDLSFANRLANAYSEQEMIEYLKQNDKEGIEDMLRIILEEEGVDTTNIDVLNDCRYTIENVTIPDFSELALKEDDEILSYDTVNEYINTAFYDRLNLYYVSYNVHLENIDDFLYEEE